ncbi:fatty acid hydroxylase [Rhodoferax lacus]|uniref:Fatty acid hydroxylase n=1 Tax=Rhodoferax lacus TaxID=2184758 RepID=A0A3E1RGK0_9BURK|nr:sterol desaturase family protein [Rhodoferax lacus]RFO98507.1 fatty acid hydroxylase [Rhodoferax lacus]
MLKKLHHLTASTGPLRRGTGLVSGVIALALGVLCLMAVLAFHFPQYLTTPQLRQSYDVAVLRQLLFWSLVLSGALALANTLLNRARWLSGVTFVCVTAAALLGGHKVPVKDFAQPQLYVGLDWLVLDLLGSTLVFICIEKLFPLRREQPVFRDQWQTDLQYFIVNHLGVGFVLLATNLMVHRFFGWAVQGGVQLWVQQLPLVAAVLLLMLVADLIQYGVHRALHEVPLLWRVHAVHHSITTVDWLAGSRLHIVEVLLMRTLVLAPIYVLGFSKEAIDIYIVIVGTQAVLNHANVNIRLGPLRYVLVTPNFHHWHHSQDSEALDRNYAGQFAFLDHLFGTAVRSDKAWPQRYGVRGDYVPQGFWKQFIFPFGKARPSVKVGADAQP